MAIEGHSSARARGPAFRALPAACALAVGMVLLAGCGGQKLDAGPRRFGAEPERVVDLGRSAEGRPLTLYVFGSTGPATLVMGGVHGSEPTGAEVAERLAQFLRTHPDSRRGRVVGVLPRANPDGLARNTRGNANGVDVNRNFPAKNWRKSPKGDSHGGPEPASESETRAIIQAVEMLRPAAIVSIHSISTNDPCNNYDGPAEALANRMAKENGYPVKASIGYPTPGSFGTWAGVERRIPVITLEFPRNLAGPVCWERNRTALLTAILGQEPSGLLPGK